MGFTAIQLQTKFAAFLKGLALSMPSLCGKSCLIPNMTPIAAFVFRSAEQSGYLAQKPVTNP